MFVKSAPSSLKSNKTLRSKKSWKKRCVVERVGLQDQVVGDVEVQGVHKLSKSQLTQ